MLRHTHNGASKRGAFSSTLFPLSHSRVQQAHLAPCSLRALGHVLLLLLRDPTRGLAQATRDPERHHLLVIIVPVSLFHRKAKEHGEHGETALGPTQCVVQPILPTAMTNPSMLAINSQGLPLTAIRMPSPMATPIPIQTAKAQNNFITRRLPVFARVSSDAFIAVSAQPESESPCEALRKN